MMSTKHSKRYSGLLRVLAFLLILCMGLSFLAACDQDDDDSPTNTEETKKEEPTPIVTPEPDPEPTPDPEPEEEDDRSLAEMLSDFLADYEDEGLSLSVTGISFSITGGGKSLTLTDGTSESLLTVLEGGKIAGDGSFCAAVAKDGDAAKNTEMTVTLRDGVIAFSDGENAGYIELEKLVDNMTELAGDFDLGEEELPGAGDEDGFDYDGLSDWLMSDLLPLLTEVYSDPDSDYPLLLSQAISNITDFSLTSTTIGINYEKLYTLNEKLATGTGKSFINYLCGKGSYDVIMKDYEAALSVKPKNLLQYLDMKGFDEDAVIQAVENFKKLQGEEDFNLKQYLNDESKKYDTVAEMLDVKDDASELKNELENKSMYALLLEHFPNITENLPDFRDEVTPREIPLDTSSLPANVAELAKTVEALIRKVETTVAEFSLSLDPLALTLNIHGLTLSSDEEDFSLEISFDSSLTTLSEKPEAPADKTSLINEAKSIASVKANDRLAAENLEVEIGAAGGTAKSVTVTDEEGATLIALDEVSLIMRIEGYLAIVSPAGVYLFEVK